MISIDYLLKVTGGDYTILREAKNPQPLGLTIRDAMIDYVKSETAAGRDIRPVLDGRFFLEKPALQGRFIFRNQTPSRSTQND